MLQAESPDDYDELKLFIWCQTLLRDKDRYCSIAARQLLVGWVQQLEKERNRHLDGERVHQTLFGVEKGSMRQTFGWRKGASDIIWGGERVHGVEKGSMRHY